MEPAGNNYRLTEKDQLAYQGQILDSLKEFPLENDLEVTAVALRAFAKNPAVVPEGCPKNLQERLQEISTSYNDPSEAYVANSNDYPMYQEIVSKAIQIKADFVEKLASRQEEQKTYFEEQQAHRETIEQNREFLKKKSLQLSKEGKSSSSIQTHDTGEREYEINHNPQIRERLDVLRSMGANQDDLLCLLPEIWDCLVEQEGQALINLQNYAQNDLFSLKEIISLPAPLAEVILFQEDKVRALLAQGVPKEDLLKMSGEALDALFAKNLENNILPALNRFQNEKELFFSIHPEAQRRAILEDVRGNKADFLKELDREAQLEKCLYYFSALHQHYISPFPLEALVLFQKNLCFEELNQHFISHFPSENEAWPRWVDIEKSKMFLLYFTAASDENMVKILSNQDAALWLLHSQEELTAALNNSSLTIDNFLSIENEEERAFFIKYSDNVAAIMSIIQTSDKEYSLSNFRENIDPERQRWVVSCWDTLQPLIQSGFSLQAVLLDQRLPMDVVQGLCLHGRGISELLNKRLDFNLLIGLPNRDFVKTLMNNSEAVVHLLNIFDADWGVFSQNPYASLIVQNALALKSLSSEDFGYILGLLTHTPHPQYLLHYAENVPTLLQQRDVLEGLGLSVDHILLAPIPFHEQILKNPQKAIEFISSGIIPVNILQTLSQQEAEAIFAAPQALAELNNHLPLLEIFNQLRRSGDPSIALFILENAPQAVALASSASLDLRALLYSSLKVSQFYLQNEEPLLLLHEQEIDINELSNELAQRVQEIKENLHVLNGKQLLAGTFSIDEEVFSEESADSSVMILASKNAQEIVAILQKNPLLRIEEFLSYIETNSSDMERIFARAEDVALLLFEGADIEILFSFSNEEFNQRCDEVCLRIKGS